jgi:hypothetical protein
VTLSAYGSGGYADRCAYGGFCCLLTVTNNHPGGATKLCAGAKANSNGSGSNSFPMGYACTNMNVYKFTQSDLLGRRTSGYATIGNGDSATHYHFSGSATYG